MYVCTQIQRNSIFWPSIVTTVTFLLLLFLYQVLHQLSCVCHTRNMLLTWVFPLPVWPYAKHVAIPWLKIVSTSGFAVYLRYKLYKVTIKSDSQNDFSFHKKKNTEKLGFVRDIMASPVYQFIICILIKGIIKPVKKHQNSVFISIFSHLLLDGIGNYQTGLCFWSARVPQASNFRLWGLENLTFYPYKLTCWAPRISWLGTFGFHLIFS